MRYMTTQKEPGGEDQHNIQGDKRCNAELDYADEGRGTYVLYEKGPWQYQVARFDFGRPP